jgi:hypothetical protein
MWGAAVRPEIVKNPPVQDNNFDCGYFVLENLIWGYLNLDGLLQEFEGKRHPMSKNWVSDRKSALGGFYKKASAEKSLAAVDYGFMQYLVRNY